MSSIPNSPLSSADLADRIDTLLRADDFGRTTWNSSTTAATTITYKFETSPAADFPWTDVGGGFQAYSTAEKAAVRSALDMIASVANIKFVESASEDPVLSFYQAYDLYTGDPSSTGGGRGRWRFTGDTWDGNVVFNATRDLSTADNLQLVIHEIGHALGLKHPGNYDVGGNIPAGPFLGGAEDNDLFSVMSYNANTANGLETRELMMYDVAALQQWWGSNLGYATANNNYGANASGRMKVVWDAGGTDRVQHSSSAAELDLRAGAFSKLGSTTNFAIAYGVTIENAITGTFDDTIQGNSADNNIDGWSGNDSLFGENGEDTLLGGDGADYLRGDDQNDTVIGGDGNDTLTGDRGDDSLDGQDNNDELWGWLGLDYLVGGWGNDTLNGEEDSDTLDGHGDDDVLNGGQGYDSMLGGDGNDLMSGGTENDTLRGGNGNDTVNGDAGDDLLFGDDGNDIVNGGDGNDILEGVKGADTLDGGDGNDVVSGGEDNDQLSGGSGNDTLWGFTGNDTMDGGSGNDIFNPEGGSDVLIFADNNGNDTVNGFASTDDAEDINLAAVTAITDFADLQMNHMSQVGADVVIDTGGGNSITLIGITLGDLQTEDFIF